MNLKTGRGSGTSEKHGILFAMVQSRLQQTKNFGRIKSYFIADVMCGEGLYDTVIGSPFQILNAIAYAKHPKNGNDIKKPISVLFNDYSKPKVARLKGNIENCKYVLDKQDIEREIEGGLCSKIYYKSQPCEKIISTILSSVSLTKNARVKGSYPIVYIDPNGAADLPATEIRNLADKNVDMIVNLCTMAHKRTLGMYVVNNPKTKNDQLSKEFQLKGITHIEIHDLVESLFTKEQLEHIHISEPMGSYGFVMISFFHGTPLKDLGRNFRVIKYSDYKQKLMINMEDVA